MTRFTTTSPVLATKSRSQALKVSSDLRATPAAPGREAEEAVAYTEGASLHPARSRNFVCRGLGEGPTSLTKYRTLASTNTSAQGKPPFPPTTPKVRQPDATPVGPRVWLATRRVSLASVGPSVVRTQGAALGGARRKPEGAATRSKAERPSETSGDHPREGAKPEHLRVPAAARGVRGVASRTLCAPKQALRVSPLAKQSHHPKKASRTRATTNHRRTGK